MGRICRGQFCVVLMLAACLPVVAADPEIKAGGVPLVLPAPADDFGEVGDRLRTTFFEVLTPTTNRLLTAYLPANTLEKLTLGQAPPNLDAYALVQVPRGAEYADCTPEAFSQVVKGVDSSIGTVSVGELQSELNARLKSLGSKPVEIGRPEMLGRVFNKTDAIAIAMLATVNQNKATARMAIGAAFLRVKQRLVFAYLYHKYESPETVARLGKNLEAWCDAILAKNK